MNNYDQEIVKNIQNSYAINEADKKLLIDNISRLTLLEKFKLRGYFQSNQIKSIITYIQILKIKLPKQEPKQNNSIFAKIDKFISPAKPRQVIYSSIFNNQHMLGSNVPYPINTNGYQIPPTLDSIHHPEQLSLINPKHLIVDSSQKESVYLNRVFNNLDVIFERISNIEMKRNYFANYLQSPLFLSYINTGISAMKYSDIEPREIVLNIMHKASPDKFLNTNQFELAATLTNHLRYLCGI